MKRKKKSRGYKVGIFSLVVILLLMGSVLFLRTLFPRPYLEDVRKVGQTYDMETSLIYAVIHTESNFRESVVSAAGAKGLMQITDETAEFIQKRLGLEDFTLDDLFIPQTNIFMGTHYLSYLQGRFAQKETVLAAYNAGPNRVQKWLEDPAYSTDGTQLVEIPFEETKEYVDKVILRERIYEILYWLDE